ncbi:MAG: Wzz/FepE/Etk N-terminal domain-containing protein [bacterium]
MKLVDYLYNLKKSWWLVLLLVVLITGLTFTISLAQTLKYRSTVRLLVGQKYQPGIDTYTATKSAEYLSSLLSEVVYSGSFMDEVLSDKNVIDSFDKKPIKRQKEWLKTVKAKPLNNTGILIIEAYSANKSQASELAQTVADVLITKGNLYHGQGDQVFIKLIDYPLTTDYPVKPNIIFNTLFGLVLGFLLGLVVIYIITELEDRAYGSISPEDIDSINAFADEEQPRESMQNYGNQDENDDYDI